MRIYIALYYKLLISKALRYGPRVTRGSHSFTSHPHTNHTCLYSPAARHYHPLAGTHCAYPQRDGQAELTWLAGHILR